MGAIFGLVGDGSAGEVAAMGQRMAHRGGAIHVWSPAPGIHLGECAAEPPARGPLALDAHLVGLDRPAIVGLIERQGLGALAWASGYFSLAYCMEWPRQVVLACDTSGFKSLYYAELCGRIAFASEYKAFLALQDFQPGLSRNAAQYYLATKSFRMDQPLMQGVHALTAGTALILRPGAGVRCETLRQDYWHPVRRRLRVRRPDLVRGTREMLLRSVRRQSSGFTRVGLMLSGGFDSGCVLALLRHVRPELEIGTYSIGFGPDDPELQGARDLSVLYGTQHRELAFAPESIPELLPRLVWLMEDCGGREEALLQYVALTEACRHERVIFGGYGADALFGGMPRCRLVRLREMLPFLGKPLREIYQLTQSGAWPASLLGRLGGRLLEGRAGFAPPRVSGAAGPVHVPDGMSLDELIAAQMCEAQDSGYIEAALESLGAQFRDPFQATDMMDLALSIPGRYNVGLLRQKKVLREAVADLLPQGVLARGKSLQRIRHDLRLSRVLDALADRYLTVSTLRARGLVEPA
ncbi:MAG: asparagine synthase-related protein, partial [Steroidobacteraceae bacterium]